MKTVILTCENWYNSYLISNKIGLPIFDVRKEINWSFDCYLFVFANKGDEELPSEMETFLIDLKIKNKNYQICELGNYFGYENPFGAADIAYCLLNKLDWKMISPILSLDTVPGIDWVALNTWIENEIR